MDVGGDGGIVIIGGDNCGEWGYENDEDRTVVGCNNVED